METRSEKRGPPTIAIAIIGGGLSGAVLAAQLLQRSDPSFSVAVVEKTSSVGRGLAYGTECRSLLLNVRARNMSALADQADHFLRWARSNYDPATGPGTFLPRAVYGHYVQSVLNEATQSVGKPRLEWIRDEALALSPTSDGLTEIHLGGGRRLLGIFLPGILWQPGMRRPVPVIFAIPGRPKPLKALRVSAAFC